MSHFMALTKARYMDDTFLLHAEVSYIYRPLQSCNDPSGHVILNGKYSIE
jgi:hypothetical protein